MDTPDGPGDSPLQTLSTREIYRNRWMTVREDAIRRQDGEETGLSAGRMRYLGRVLTAPGYSDQGRQVFLAEQLIEGARQLSPEESDLETTRVEFSQFPELVREGRIRAASTLAACALLHIHGLMPLPSRGATE